MPVKTAAASRSLDVSWTCTIIKQDGYHLAQSKPVCVQPSADTKDIAGSRVLMKKSLHAGRCRAVTSQCGHKDRAIGVVDAL